METFHIGLISEFKDREKKVFILNDNEVGVFRMGNDFFAARILFFGLEFFVLIVLWLY